MRKVMKKMMVLLLSLVMVMVMLTGCKSSSEEKTSADKPSDTASDTKDGEEEAAEKEIKVGIAYEMDSLDPAQANVDVDFIVMFLAGEALVRSVEGKAVPGGAQSWEANEGNTEYTFHLRKEAAFNDGTAITAESYKYSLLRTLDPEKAYANTSKLSFITNADKYAAGEAAAEEVGIEVIDEYTIKITCAVPTYPISFSTVAFLPLNQEFVEAAGEQYGTEADKVLTNGAFKITDWVHDSQVTMVKNETYWDAEAIHLTKIDGMINATGDTAVDMMLAGDLDAVEFASAEPVGTLSDAGFSTVSYVNGYQFLNISYKGATEETGKWLNNKNFRLALSYALDRTALVQSVYTSDIPASRLTGVTEVGADQHFNEEYPYTGWNVTQDTAKAEEYMKLAMTEMGVSSVEEIPAFTMLCFDSSNNMDALNAVADMWLKTLGIKCEIDAQPISTMVSKAVAGEFDFWKGGQAVSSLDWLDFLQGFTTEANQVYFYKDAEFDKLYNTANTAATWKERKDAMYELEKYFCENVVDLQVTWSQSTLVFHDRVTGITINTDAMDYTYADVTE